MTVHRCSWVPENNELYKNYHDKEWGVPVHDDRTHFEFLTLEGAQAGLNWQHFLEIQQEFGSFDNYIWRFVKGKPLENHRISIKEVPAETAESRALSAQKKDPNHRVLFLLACLLI